MTEDNLSCEHLMERKDLSNIQRPFGLKIYQRHQNDLDSVLAWITEWRGSPDVNPILFHKFQGKTLEGYDLAKDDIVIVIQSSFQRSMLRKFGPNGVSCDSTHGTNGYHFLLTTFLLINEFGEEFPAAWCISNQEDFTTMCKLFSEVKKNTGTISSSWFMSDIAPQFYNAWVGVMDECPRPQNLLCTWHVDKATTYELRKKLVTATELEVYKKQLMKHCLMTACTVFSNALASPQKTASFKKYFER